MRQDRCGFPPWGEVRWRKIVKRHSIVYSPPERTVEGKDPAALDVEIQRIQETPPTQAELDIAVKQSRAMFAFGSESITNQAYWMGYAEMFADVSWFTSFLDRLKQVTPEDVQRAAQTYLLPKNRVRGDYYPTGPGELDGELDDFVEED